MSQQRRGPTCLPGGPVRAHRGRNDMAQRRTPDVAEPSEIVVCGVTRRRDYIKTFWRVRHRPEGWWLVEWLGRYRGRPAWRMRTQSRTREEAIKSFNSVARPSPPG